jgi:carboxymethylenebutenolidase
MSGKMIEFKGNGETYQGYFSPAFNRGPGIIVIQEWWGLVDHIKDICDRFAEAGFTTLAPDLYHGQKTKSPDEASKMLMALNIDDASKVLRGAIDTLIKEYECTSDTVGVVGFCMGGQLALYAAATNPDRVSACVDFYGIHPAVKPPLQDMKAAVLGIFAEKDHSVDASVVAGLKEQLEQAGVEHELLTYPGTDHAFFNDTRPEVHNPEAAEDAWKRMLIFFRNHVPARD